MSHCVYTNILLKHKQFYLYVNGGYYYNCAEIICTFLKNVHDHFVYFCICSVMCKIKSYIFEIWCTNNLFSNYM